MTPSDQSLLGLSAANTDVYADERVQRTYERDDAWVCLGEKRTMQHVAPLVRGTPILDVGVGGGRTATWLQLLSDDYVAIDNSPEMVALCKRREPQLDVRVADARNLAEFDDRSFGFVLFSFNGVDLVGHRDRAVVLAELWRVLRPGGIVVLSTLNRDGMSFGEVPWQLHRPHTPHSFDVRRVVKTLARVVCMPGAEVRRYRNWWKHAHRAEDHGEWSIYPLAAHGFQLMAHFSTLNAARNEVRSAGLDLVATYDGGSGVSISDDTVESRADCFYLVGRRPSVAS